MDEQIQNIDKMLITLYKRTSLIFSSLISNLEINIFLDGKKLLPITLLTLY